MRGRGRIGSVHLDATHPTGLTLLRAPRHAGHPRSTWYEIVRVQTAGGNAIQQFCACTQLIYTPLNDSTVGDASVLNSCRFENPSGFFLNATSYLNDMGPAGHWIERYFPGGPPASYNIILAGQSQTTGVPYAVEYDCSDNALFGSNYCIHVLSRAPDGLPRDEATAVVNQAIAMGLNPLNRPINYTMQDGCW